MESGTEYFHSEDDDVLLLRCFDAASLVTWACKNTATAIPEDTSLEPLGLGPIWNNPQKK